MRAVMAVGFAFSLVFAEPQVAQEEPTIEVRTFHERGMTRFESGDYEAALILWKRAFVLLPHTDLTLRPALVADIVEAHTRAYDVGRNPEHLAEAIRVVDLRKAEIVRFHQAGLGEMNKLDAQRAELARLHELARSQGEVSSELSDGLALEIESAPPPALTRRQLETALARDHELGREFRKAKAMKDAGFVLLMIGVGAVPLAAVLTAQSFNPKDGVAPILPYLIPAPIIVAVPLIVGGTLHAVGKKRKQRITAQYEDRPNLEPIPVPLALPRGGGIGFAGRF